MTSDKKVIEIHGVLQKPLEIGSSTFILEDNGIRRTSTVLEYKQVSENEIHFETLNTIYHLRTMSIKSRPLWNKSTFNMKTKSPKQRITKKLRKRNGKSKKTSQKTVGGNNLCPKIIKIIK